MLTTDVAAYLQLASSLGEILPAVRGATSGVVCTILLPGVMFCRRLDACHLAKCLIVLHIWETTSFWATV